MEFIHFVHNMAKETIGLIFKDYIENLKLKTK